MPVKHPGRLALTPAAAMLLLAAVISAWGDAPPRFASPGGTSVGLCTSDDPCDLPSALRGARDGDTVVVLPGTYELGAQTVAVMRNVVVRGADGQPRPVLTGSAVKGVLEVREQAPGAVIEHLAIDATGAKGLHLAVGTAEDVIVHTVARGASACHVGSARLQDSVCWQSGPGGHGVKMWASQRDESSAIVSSTVVGPEAVRVVGFLQHLATLAVEGSILLGGTAPGDHDLATLGDGSVGVTTSYSNYDDIGPHQGSGTATITADHQQTAQPVFADAGFHQAAGSPTIDAGPQTSQAGPTDFDGDPRVIAGRVDIGADEFGGPPAVATRPATAIGTTSATLNGTLGSHGVASTHRFEYGGTTAYGSSTPAATAGAGSGPADVSAVVTGLRPDVPYHFRLVADNGFATATGLDETFTTLALGAGAPPSSNSPAGPQSGGERANGPQLTALRVTPRSIRVGGRARLRFFLTAATRVRVMVFAVQRARRCRACRRRIVRVPGSILIGGREGINRLSFSGRLGGRTLRPGRYRLVLRSAGGRRQAAWLRIEPRSRG
jgi:hypothetical protein